jgi:hypothetical protein
MQGNKTPAYSFNKAWLVLMRIVTTGDKQMQFGEERRKE